MAAVAALAILTLGPLGFYVALGSPNIPGEPAFARVTTPKGQESIASFVSQVEAHLATSPNDGAGWEVLAPVYTRLGRFDDAVQARKKALLLNGATATREADLGEAETAAANGVVTAEAKAAFERAVASDPKEAKARYFLGLAAEQDGRNDEAASIWRSMVAEAPTGAPWVAFVRQALARVSGGPVATVEPSTADISAVANMSEDARRDTIRGMVARLADRLHDNGGDVEGWLRLVRAYVVLGDRTKAKDAAADAKRALGERARRRQTHRRSCQRPRTRRLTPHHAGTTTAMTRKRRRLVLIGGALCVLAVAVGLMLNAFRDSIVFFNSPSDVAEKRIPAGTRIRIGGLVKPGSVAHGDNLKIRFEVTDGNRDVVVAYQGVLPDLFREGQGVVAEGALDGAGQFNADTILAKHDETYMPKEVADALKKSGHWKDAYGQRAAMPVGGGGK